MKDNDQEQIEWRPRAAPGDNNGESGVCVVSAGRFIQLGSVKITAGMDPLFRARDCLDHWTIKPWFSQQKQGFKSRVASAKKMRELGPAAGLRKAVLVDKLRALHKMTTQLKDAKLAQLQAAYISALGWSLGGADSDNQGDGEGDVEGGYDEEEDAYEEE
jgi:hypothetical protein